MEGARIYAQNAIREKNQSLNFLRLGSRVDAVAARLESAIRMQVYRFPRANTADLTDSMNRNYLAVYVSQILSGISRHTVIMHFKNAFSNILQEVSKVMGQTVSGMASAMKGMQVDQIAKTMAEFEKQFEDMDVTSGSSLI